MFSSYWNDNTNGENYNWPKKGRGDLISLKLNIVTVPGADKLKSRMSLQSDSFDRMILHDPIIEKDFKPIHIKNLPFDEDISSRVQKESKSTHSTFGNFINSLKSKGYFEDPQN